MPGILPMKVIKVGSNSSSRIAQACDRCRSKKIRCDGVTPCCTQCKNVGFECKTSDKLSRRAFPRGYTESLEERVRNLEAEVRELKDLLDEKDEKIDLLSRVQSFSPRKSSASPPALEHANSVKQDTRDDTYKVHQLSTLQKCDHKSDPFFVGSSSTRVFIYAIAKKIQESGKAAGTIDTSALISRCDLAKPAKRADFSRNISRLASDQLVNIFFQEWAPLLPVLHRPTFLDLYAEFINDAENTKDPASVAQLNLVFGVAALANESSTEFLPLFEAQWQGALGAIVNETKLVTLQCLILAQLYCMIRGDSNKLVYYRGVAANMSHRLGLHQSQKRFSLGVLTRETRKKVFWSLYTIDVFGAVSLGLPKLLKDEDVETEEPADVDDENVNEQGFQSATPGESTKLSSALALFRLAHVLSSVQKELYPMSSTYDLSLQKVGSLSAELDRWRNNLAPHLRLEFAKDKPSTNVISSRCPLLGLFYYHVRMLIHRAILQADISEQSNSSILAVADCSKHIVQVLQLLQERNLSYTACISKSELVISCGFGLIYQVSELPPDSKLRKDTQQSIQACVDLLERSGVPAVICFRKIAQLYIPQPEFARPTRRGTSSGGISPKSSQEMNKSAKGQLQAIATRFSLSSVRNSKSRTLSTRSEQLPAKPEQCRSNPQLRPSSTSSEPAIKSGRSKVSLSLGPLPQWTPNLDYLPLGTPTSIASSMDTKATVTGNQTDWDGLLNSLDLTGPASCTSTTQTTFPQCAGNTSPQFAVRHSSDASFSTPPVPLDWSSIEWNAADTSSWASLFDANLSAAQDQHLINHLHNQAIAGGPKSVLSFSNDNTSGEDLSSCDLGSEFKAYSITNDDYYSLRDTASPTAASAKA